jgi:Ca2+-binding EF-hand superfamily protein
MSDETEKIDLEELISNYKVSDEEAFKAYLKELWLDLTQRNQDKSNTGISKITFSNYYNLPGIILDRLFSVLDTNKSGFLETQEFISGMCILFCGDFDSQTNFIFKFYDFDKTGQISKEDIRTVLSYISLSQEIKNYKDRVSSQKELLDIIEKCFSKIHGDKMNYNQFKKCIEEINSDIYLMILLFLYEKKPFTKAVLNTYTKLKPKISISPLRSPVVHSPAKMVASPSKHSSFSPYNIFSRERKRTATVKEAIGIGIDGVKQTRSRRHSTIQQNVINLIDIGMSKKSKFNNENEQNSPKKSPKKDKNDPEYYSPILRKRKRNLKELKNKENVLTKLTEKSSKKNIEENIQLMPAYKQGKNSKNDDKSSETGSILSGDLLDAKKDELLAFGSDEENSGDEEEQEDVVTTEGYLVKIVDNKMKRIFFRLVGRDLFYFKSEKDELHKGMHNLSGVFINEENPKVVNGKKFFCFSVTYPKKTRYYYVEKEDEYKTWVEKLKIATGFTNLLDLYEVKEKIGNGKFGLIKLGVNKKTGQKVAIKIMSKKDMTNQDLELVRTEIEILKICQHPNIIELYEVFENVSYFYIIMEYCPGGDLFSYLEQRNFRLPEEQACKFMHKMCAAIYYCHSYGIAHRDLNQKMF